MNFTRGLWPARCPNLTPLDFYVWAYTNKVSKNSLHTLKDLEPTIQFEIDTVTPNELESVFKCVKRPLNLRLEK